VNNIIKYIKETEKVYSFNTENFCFYMYGLIKMIKPKTVLELGTGLGTTTFLAAQACKENNYGKVISIDDGSQCSHIINDYRKYINSKIKKFNLNKHCEFIYKKLNLISLEEIKDVKDISILFNDINSEPQYFFSILTWLIPKLNNKTYFIIDKTATFLPTRNIIDVCLKDLNVGKVPKVMYDMTDDKTYLENKIRKLNFSIHYVERKNDIFLKNKLGQDSFAVLKIEENNYNYPIWPIK
jgi:hypothetical protein